MLKYDGSCLSLSYCGHILIDFDNITRLFNKKQVYMKLQAEVRVKLRDI